jgi:hypothetical protein
MPNHWFLPLGSTTPQRNCKLGYYGKQATAGKRDRSSRGQVRASRGIKSRTDRRFVILSLTPAAEKALRSLSTAHIRELRGVTPVVRILVNLLKAEHSPRRLGAKE